MFRLLMLLALLYSTPAVAQVIEGTATVVDGDTIDMTGTRIRLAHIDAPEAKQVCEKDEQEWACGFEATAILASLVDGQKLSCTVLEHDIYGRAVATCQTRSFNLGTEMVRRGMAVLGEDAPYDYAAALGVAKRMNWGLWASTFQEPAEWRAANPQHASRAAGRAERGQVRATRVRERVYRNQYGCAIKGNRSRRGEWIYHLPGRPYYDATRAEELFCTESEAQAAGYRRSRA
ncbi:thermonuclease family protein [Erythrobacter sp.]|uniref:thermonuclease family protein n=1 Tax=Erythrobacter sp. TaxID=1042 RepID=UPI001425C020|nr:thermonuclease family protein [Erythrobacter sp.]QIQ87965.1 MAG: thermonuclease family protein [Erythrobacter sp.]